MTDDVFFGGLVPDLVPLAKSHRERCERAGLKLVFLWGVRTRQQQLDLYTKGRELTATGWTVTDHRLIVTNALPESSAHCHGAAYDCVPLDSRDKIDWLRLDLFQAVAKLAPVGLTWGGTFPIHDLDHFELSNWRSYPVAA